MNNILVTTSSFAEHNPELSARLRERSLHVILNPYRRKLAEAEAADLIDRHRPVGIIAGVEPLTREVLAKARGLKVISRCGIGLDSVDLEAAGEFNITVTNTPDAPTIPVAELTVGLILTLLRAIPASDAGIRRGQWVRPMGNLLHGKTVGIVGCGRIGTHVARLLTAFGCRLLGYDPMVKSNDHCAMVTLADIVAQSDIISLHLPYASETHHLLDAAALSSMKQGACLINAARGGLVDEQALFTCLRDGHLAGAALDCFEQEPYRGPLIELDNVVLTGHIGSYAREGRTLMEEQAVENLLRELAHSI